MNIKYLIGGIIGFLILGAILAFSITRVTPTATGTSTTVNAVSDSISSDIFNNTSSTELIDLPGSEFPPITLTRDTKLFISLDVLARNTEFNNSGGAVEVAVFNGDEGLMSVIATGVPNALGVEYQFSGRSRSFVLPAGTHNLKLKYRSTNANGQANIAGFDFNYIKLEN